MQNRLYIGNLPWSFNDQGLKDLFAAAGTVQSATVIVDRDSGRSKGFGFVEMATEEEAQKAIEMFNGSDQGGRPLVVNVARPREERSDRSF